MNYSFPDFAVEDDDPFAAVFDSKTLMDRGGGELGEIMWEESPVFRRFPSPDCEVSIGEEEVVGWLRFSPEKGGDKGPVGPPEGKEAMASMVGSNVVSELRGLPPESRISRSAGTSGPLTNFSGSRGDVRKRKGRDSDESDAEDADYDTDNKKKENRRLTRKARATEVHNLSERRRRDRINDKMKALQQLIPRCNKSDKASMLEDAVEYVKSLQYQIQMMCMGCAIPPMIYPGIPQYAHPMGMAMDTALGCLTHPMLPFTTVQASPISGATTAHVGAGLPIQNVHPTAALYVKDQPRGMKQCLNQVKQSDQHERQI